MHFTHPRSSRVFLAATAVVLLAAAAQAAPPATTPEPFELVPGDRSFQGGPDAPGIVELTTRPGLPPLSADSLSESLRVLRWRPMGPGSEARADCSDAEIVGNVTRARVSISFAYPEALPSQSPLMAQFVDRLNALAQTTAGLSDAERQKQLQEVNASIDRATTRRMTLIGVIARFQELASQREQLQGQLMGKPSRQQALEQKIAELRQQAQDHKHQDPIALELQKIVELRTRQWEQAQAALKEGRLPSAEVDQKAIELSEAKVRLAERENSLARSGKGEILDRLTDELTLLSVDVTNLEIQLAAHKKEMVELDPDTIRPETLDSLAAAYRGAEKNLFSASPLYDALQNQRRALLRQRLALVLAHASLVPVQADPATMP